jgi:hypothetical protein
MPALPSSYKVKKPHRVPKAVISPQSVRIAPSQVVAGSKEGRGARGQIAISSASSLSPAATTLTSGLITAISGLSFSATPTQAECEALRDNVVTALNAVLTDLGNRESDATQLATDIGTASGSLTIVDDPSSGGEYQLD